MGKLKHTNPRKKIAILSEITFKIELGLKFVTAKFLKTNMAPDIQREGLQDDPYHATNAI
ncbi:hypothetical protein AVO41_01225 [Thiomicrospira sp. WB1]|nr:hypothetical protein AVO41_01225 [Thiomicrospira sp. WB1]